MTLSADNGGSRDASDVIKVNPNWQDRECLQRWPLLFSVLKPVWKGDKNPRLAGTIKIRITGSQATVTLNAPTEGVQCTIVITSLTTAFDEVEKVLAAQTAVWNLDWDSQRRSRQPAKE